MLKTISTTIVLLSFAVSAFASADTKKTPLPFASSELLEFVGRGDQKMIDFGKTSDFVGVITRVHEKGDTRIVDLYEFKNIEAVPMDKALCEKVLAKIFGPLDKISLKVSKIEIFASHTGKTCEAQLDDEDKEAKIAERRVIIGFLNAKPVALVTKMSKKSGKTEQESIRKFWDTLR